MTLSVMPLQIRNATLSDLEALVPIQREVQQLHIDALPERYLPVSAEAFQLCMNDILKSTDSRVLVAESNSQIVGYAVVQIKNGSPNPFTRPSRFALVDQLAVLSSERRQGIATALMRAAATFARAEGCSEILLDVLHFNEEATAFYEAIGFDAFRQRMRMAIDG